MIDTSRYIGLPFERNGRGPTFFDCWGLVVDVMRELGREVPDWGPYTAREALRILRDETRSANWVKTQWRPYSILVMGSASLESHAGVTVPGNAVLHASSEAGCVVVERMISIRRRYGRCQCYRSRQWDV